MNISSKKDSCRKNFKPLQELNLIDAFLFGASTEKTQDAEFIAKLIIERATNEKVDTISVVSEKELSGIDIFHPDFINEDGNSRIAGLWDQSGNGTPPDGYYGGVYYDRDRINEAVQKGREEGRRLISSVDASGHGTHVAGIAAGNSVSPLYRGVAPESELIIVKLRGNISADPTKPKRPGARGCGCEI